MGDRIINNNLHDDQETDAVDTLSLTDFPITQDHQNPPSSSVAGDFFEFFQGGLTDYSEEKMMSHAEDIIICGKLAPINEQRYHKQPPQQSEKHQRRNQHSQSNLPIGCRRSRSDSMANVKSITASPLVRNSRSFDYKKLNRNSSMCSEPAKEISRDGSGKKSSSSRWYVLLFGLVKVPPPEMDLRDMKIRQVRRTSSNPYDVIPVNQSVDHRNCSWRVLGYLSCKSSSNVAITTPMPKV